MIYIEGEKYYFKVIKSDKKISVVSDGENEYIYPGELLYDSTVGLSVSKVLGEKLYFDTNPFKTLDEKIIPCELLSIGETENFGLAKINYNNFIFYVSFPKWITHSNLLKEKNSVLIKHFTLPNGKIRLSLKFKETISHYKYEYSVDYNFKVISINQDLLILKDPEDNLTYKAYNHYSNIELKEGDDIKLNFGGLDKWLNPNLFLKESNFVNPNKILNRNDAEYLIKDKSFDYETQNQLKNQIKLKDSFWIITAIKFFPEFIKYSMNKGDLEEAVRSISLFKKLSGFIDNRGFFRSIPNSTSDSVEPYYIENREYINNLFKLIEFQKDNDLEDLFKSDLNLSIDNQLEILNASFLNKIINNDSLNIVESIVENIELSISSNEKKFYLINKVGSLFLQMICKPILQRSNEIYFSNSSSKKEWLLKERINTIVLTCEIFLNYRDCFRPYKILNFELIKVIKNISFGNNLTSDEKIGLIQSGLEQTLNLEEEPPKIINTDTYRFENKIIILSSTLGIYITKDCIFLLIGPNLHLFNFYISQKNNIDCKVESNFNNKLILLKVVFSEEISVENDLIDDDIINVIFKGDYHTNDQLFVTHNFKDQIAVDGLLRTVPHNFKTKQRYKVGDMFKAKVSISSHNGKVFLFEKNERYLISPDQINKNYEATVVKIKNAEKLNSCPGCRKTLDVQKSKIIKYCVGCRKALFEYVELYLKEIDKTIYINRYSIKKSFGSEKISSLSVGQVYDIHLKNSQAYTYVYPWDETKRIRNEYYYDIEIGKLRGLDFNFDYHSSFTCNQIGYFLYMGLVELSVSNESIEKNDSEAIEKSILNLSRKYKSPKSYLVFALNRYKKIVSPLLDKLEITKDFVESKIKFIEDFTNTVKYFQEFESVIETLNVIENLSLKNYSFLISIIEKESNESTKKLAKLILIRCLIENEGESKGFIKSIDSQIKGIIKNNITELSFGSTFVSEVEEDENLKIIKDIEAKEITESSEIEFKETLFCPVLNKGQLDIIKNLSSKIIEEPEKEDKYRKKINEITKSIDDKIYSKSIHKKLAYSTIKNICAMLNSNSGKVIIGIRDDGELIGLKNDYNITSDFDEFQQKFESYWKNLVVDNQVFRPYININKVSYKNMDFVVFDVVYPEQIDDPCYVLDPDNNNEICLVKNSSTTDKLDIRSIRKWKRKRGTMESIPTYIYLMKDTNNKIKIGISKNPEKRRGTLMAQDSGTELIKKYLFPDRKVAYYHEKHLHKIYLKYNTNNGKGEWFNLDDRLLSEVKEYLDKISSNKRKADYNLFDY